MELKLAEYNLETGKFERFLELEKPHQIDGENIIGLFCSRKSMGFCLANNAIVVPNQETNKVEVFLKDETDPLNRFDGLFNDRSFGEGRFVLIVNSQDDVFKEILNSNEEIRASYRRDGVYTWCKKNLIGNLHKNPELYEKIKYKKND